MSIGRGRQHVGTQFLGYDLNEYGTQISLHECGACGRSYWVCPATPDDDACVAPECPSFDPDRYLGGEHDEDQTFTGRPVPVPERGQA